LAGLGVGAVRDAKVGGKWRGDGVRHTPNAATLSIYDELARRRGELYERTRGLST
jgi:hypothetical protein